MQVAESVSAKERERQEIIFELVYTERDFVRNLDYLQKVNATTCYSLGTKARDTEHVILVLDRAPHY